MREASLRPSHFSLPAAISWAGQWWWGGRGDQGGCGGAAVWRCGGAGVRLVLAHDEEFDQRGLAAAHAAARLVDDR